ncbi:uncharacterized protein A1O9_11426 [Exophiala aquamarina CBS 119918]|uniref:Alpha-methylacyl-CoA racemase n=1 Tax=Exophiala aquamarina CBS 119918 TaxID=1182545 RepID=A0A072NZZ1_9EURO|nr:uncharacterized protein A1O9_11426 [Exophiala aquamarina CBS 119918]KEF52583.1 hypothetical protein A1O9_11426 [Exophiala aquamarina CBS 119918]
MQKSIRLVRTSFNSGVKPCQRRTVTIAARIPRLETPREDEPRRLSPARCKSSASNDTGSTSSTRGTTDNLPLSGLRVLDLSRVLAGPFCTQILADYGAEVVKVEQPGVGDETRQWRAANEAQMWKNEYPLMSLYFAAINRNKRSVTLNLKTPQGVEIVKHLARQSDVVVNNFVPGKMEAMGLGYEALRKENERLVYASVSGYGSSGPSKDRAGYDALALAEAGLLHITGEEGRLPSKPGVAMADLCTGLYAHGAILAALAQRERTGLGTNVEGSLFESSLSLLINVGLASMNLDRNNGPEARRRGKRMGLEHPNLVPYGGFETKDKKMVYVAANNRRQWDGFCNRLQVEGLGQNERFHSNDDRVANREEINGILQKRFKEKTKDEWMQAFEGSGLPYGAINDVVEAVEHPQAQARNMIMEVDDFEAAKDGVLRLIGPAMKFQDANMSVRMKPPLLGEHTNEVLSDLGYTVSDITSLRKSGII